MLVISSKICNNTSNKVLRFSKKAVDLRQKKNLNDKKFVVEWCSLKNNADVIILITWLMCKSLLKSKDVLYQFSSDLGEVHSFYSSFSDTSQKTPLLIKSLKNPAWYRVNFQTRAIIFYLKFFACIWRKGFSYRQKWSIWLRKSHAFANLF